VKCLDIHMVLQANTARDPIGDDEGYDGGEGGGEMDNLDNTYGSIDLMNDTIDDSETFGTTVLGSTKKSFKSVTINVPPTPEIKTKHTRTK